MPRIFYLQYTNPAAYPPLQHSASMLAEQGWDVLFIGIGAAGAASLVLPAHERIRYQQVARNSGGARGSFKYVRFMAAAITAAARFRPDWCYASDALSAPAAVAMSAIPNVRILYHEHDAPGTTTRNVIMAARRRLARVADIVVAPAAKRLKLVPPGPQPRFVVWNCPRLGEVATAEAPADPGRFKLVYHGSLSRDRLTPQIIDALGLLPPNVELHVYGYETAGHRSYISELLQQAAALGVSERIHYHGAVPARAELLRQLRGHQLGISTVAPHSSDANLHSLAGASNKSFEYLAQGIPLLVTAQPQWSELFVTPGYGVACVPTDAQSIATAIEPLLRDPQRGRAMGEAGRQRVLHEWNYEQQFAPVLRELRA